MANKTLQAVVNLAGSIDPSLGKAIQQATNKISGLNVKALAVGAAVGGIAVATGKAVVEAGKYLKDLGSQFDEAADAIRIGTGATGEALDGLLDDFDEVYKSVPTTMEDASKAIADYNTRLGLTGPALQDISKQAIQVSDMLGDDLGGVIESSSQAFQQWNIDADNMGGAMDYIFKVSQSTGMGFTDLMSDMQKFGPQLQEMGYSFETASALMGQLDKAGVNVDEVLGAMKKSVGSLAKEGISASDGIAMYYEQIKNAGSAAEAASIASEIFGSRAGSTMAAAIRDGTLAVGDLTAELTANGETIAGAAEDTYDFAERLQVMKQGLEVALKPMANTVFDGLNKFMPVLQKLMEQIVPVIGEAVEAAAPFVEEFLMGAADALEQVLPLISNLASSLLPILTQLMSSLLPPVVSLLNLIMPLLSPLLSLLQPIASVLGTIVNVITKIVSFGSGVISKIAGLFGGGGGGGAAGFAAGGFTNGISIAGEDPRYPTEAVISFNPAYRTQNLAYWAKAGEMLGATGADIISRIGNAISISVTGFAAGGFTNDDGGRAYSAIAGQTLADSDGSDYELLSGGDNTSVVYDLSGLIFSPQIKIEGDTDEDALIRKLRELEPEFVDFILEALARREGGAYVTADSRLY